MYDHTNHKRFIGEDLRAGEEVQRHYHFALREHSSKPYEQNENNTRHRKLHLWGTS